MRQALKELWPAILLVLISIVAIFVLVMHLLYETPDIDNIPHRMTPREIRGIVREELERKS